MDGAGAGGAAPERRKQLTAAEAVNHKRQLAQMVERELALTGADSVTDFDDALQMVLVETAFGRYPKHLLDVYTGKVVGRQERGDVVKSWQHVEKMSASGSATGDVGDDGFGDDDEILPSSPAPPSLPGSAASPSPSRHSSVLAPPPMSVSHPFCPAIMLLMLLFSAFLLLQRHSRGRPSICRASLPRSAGSSLPILPGQFCMCIRHPCSLIPSQLRAP